uniref:Uncharacterized protein n=1 Tax=Trichogramma kaykai TaxID=54128 RepID=A0ABD2VZP3_9HYME
MNITTRPADIFLAFITRIARSASRNEPNVHFKKPIWPICVGVHGRSSLMSYAPDDDENDDAPSAAMSFARLHTQWKRISVLWPTSTMCDYCGG